MKILVTGCGRSGTGYMSQVLRACGITCGHENVYHPETVDPWQWGSYMAESSWLAVPHIHKIISDHRADVFIVHLVRDPIACGRSLLHFFKGDRNAFHSAIATFSPWVLDREASFVEQFFRYWVTWNRQAQAYADLRLRIEDSTSSSFCEIVADLVTMAGYVMPPQAVRDAIAQVPRNYNTRHAHDVMSWSDLRASACGMVVEEIALDYGYSHSEGASCVPAMASA